MKTQPVVSWKNLPSKIPILSSIVWWMFLDRIKAPEWAWGVVGVVAVIFWVGAIVRICRSTQKEIWPS